MSNNSKTLLSSSISKIFGVAVLRNDGSRIYSKYFNRNYPESVNICKEGDLNDVSIQKSFEKNIFEKSKKLVNTKSMKSSDTEIFGYGRFTLLFKILQDVHIYIIADPDENEALLSAALECIVDCMNTFSKEPINNKIVTENFQCLILIIDEVFDQGIIVNIDPSVIQARFLMLDCDSVQNTAQPSNSASTTTTTTTQSTAASSANTTVGFLKSFFNR